MKKYISRTAMTWTTLLFVASAAMAQTTTAPTSNSTEPKKWYDKLSIRGYAQLHYNRLGDPNRFLLNDQGDKSIRDNTSLFLRRARLVLSGDVTENLYVYIQPDFASAVSGGTDANHFVQLRDFYADISIDPKKEFRFRAGQSKVPYGFENLQSSQNRGPLDRDDALNSAVLNERDLAVYFMWAPEHIRARFKHLVDSGLKGSGDYGVVAVGIMNGQTANKSEANNNRHWVGRITYPHEFEFSGKKIIEASVQTYSGIFTAARSTGVAGNTEIPDRRIATSLILYPQPIGFQLEWNWGRGPTLNAQRTRVNEESLAGGYAMVNYKYDSFFPFARWQLYNGGKKHETNAPRNKVREFELGLEWQALKSIELTASYSFTDRTSSVSPFQNFGANLTRLQLQWSY